MILIVGDPKLDADLQGVCVARELVRFAGSIYGLEDHLSESWSCGACLGETWTGRHAEFPAYFSYLLGHELGHASTVLTDLTLACFESLVFGHIKAVTGDSELMQGDLPFEARYDQFGLAIAEAICGRAQVERDFERIREQGLSEDVRRLEMVLATQARHDVEGIRQDIAAFTEGYKEELIASWQEQQKSIAPGLTGLVTDFEWLWTKQDG